MNRKSAFALILMVLFLISVNSSSAYAFNGSYLNINNETVSFSNYEGKITIIEAMQTRCGACRNSGHRSDMNYLYANYRDQINFVSVGVFGSDTIEDVQDFVNRFSISYDAGIDNNDVIENLFSVSATPTTILVNENGEYLNRWVGIDHSVADYMNVLNSYVDNPVTDIPEDDDDTIGGGSGSQESIVGNLMTNPIFQGGLAIFVVITLYFRTTSSKT